MVNLIQGAKKSRDQLDYDNDKCTILSVAFQREKEIWKPWLEKTLVGYFHQFLLRNWFIRSVLSVLSNPISPRNHLINR